MKKNVTGSEVSLLALGGYGKLIANMTALIYDKSIVVIDAGKGMEIPEKWKYLSSKNLSKLTPTFAKMKYLDEYLKNGYQIKGVIITHPHGDHIAGIQQFYKYLSSKNVDKTLIPLYASKFTMEFGKKSIPGWNTYSGVVIKEDLDYEIEPGVCTFNSFFLVHSSYHSAALNFNVKGKKILFLPDHKRDFECYMGPSQHHVDKKLSELFDTDLDCLVLESTTVDAAKEKSISNKTLPEAAVYHSIRNLICRESDAKNNIFCSTYSTNPSRLKAIIDAGALVKRTVAIYGRGMWNGFSACVNAGLFHKDQVKHVVKLEDLSVLNGKEKFIVLTTGHMGESSAKLPKLLRGEEAYNWNRKDLVILASSTIPKESARYCRATLITQIMSKRIDYYTGEDTPGLHCTGHIGHPDFVKYVLWAKNCKKVILNHGDIESTLMIYPLLQSMNVSTHKYVTLKDGEVEFI